MDIRTQYDCVYLLAAVSCLYTTSAHINRLLAEETDCGQVHACLGVCVTPVHACLGVCVTHQYMHV